MSNQVETKTRELCEAILQHIQSGGIKQRLDTFLADASARGAYESLMSKGQALQEKQHSGQTLEPAEIAAFEKDRDALLKNPVASGFANSASIASICWSAFRVEAGRVGICLYSSRAANLTAEAQNSAGLPSGRPWCRGCL